MRLRSTCSGNARSRSCRRCPVEEPMLWQELGKCARVRFGLHASLPLNGCPPQRHPLRELPSKSLGIDTTTGTTMEDLIAEHIPTDRTPDGDPPASTFEYPKKPIVSYAQTHEDVLLWRALHNVQHGFYIDVGAHDPTALSVTRAFYEHGWHGINVEPDPQYAEKLRKERPPRCDAGSCAQPQPWDGYAL